MEDIGVLLKKDQEIQARRNPEAMANALRSRQYDHGLPPARTPTSKEIKDAIDVGMGRVSRDVVYGEKGLEGGVPTDPYLGLSPLDLIGTGIGTKLAGFGAAGLTALGATALASKASQGAKFSQLANALRGQRGATAWHGSPHLFDKFKNEAIGTGEGAQAYGMGHYLAEAPAVAKEYMKVDPSVVLPPNRLFQGQALQSGTPQYHAATLVDSMGLPTARKNVAQWIADAQDNPEMVREVAGWKQTLDTLNSATKKTDFKTAPNVPNLYKTDIPDTHIDKMLDWDKPLSQQSQQVQGLINAAHDLRNKQTGGRFMPIDPLTSGQDLVRTIGEGRMQQVGIPGIKYLDGSSRTAGDGTRNFVMFDPNSIKILERNGISTGASPWTPNEYETNYLRGAGK